MLSESSYYSTFSSESQMALPISPLIRPSSHIVVGNLEGKSISAKVKKQGINASSTDLPS